MLLKCLAGEGNSQSEAVPKDISGSLSLCVKTSSLGMSMENVTGNLAPSYQSVYVEIKHYFRYTQSALVRLRRVKTDKCVKIDFAIRGLWLFSREVKKVFFPPLGYLSIYLK